MKSLRVLSLSAVALMLVGAAGCGGGNDDNNTTSATTNTQSTSTQTTSKQTTSGNAGGATASTVSMKEYEFNPSDVTVKKGSTVTVKNTGKIAHNLTVLQGSTKVAGTSTFLAGKSEKLTVNAKPGKYTMECTVPGHAQLGMKGTFTVK